MKPQRGQQGRIPGKPVSTQHGGAVDRFVEHAVPQRLSGLAAHTPPGSLQRGVSGGDSPGSDNIVVLVEQRQIAFGSDAHCVEHLDRPRIVFSVVEIRVQRRASW